MLEAGADPTWVGWLSAMIEGKGVIKVRSCPLTVEKGKIVLAEFGYGGQVMPSFPKWLIDGTRPARLSWLLKSEALPWVYWNGMLKGHEWLVKPQPIARVLQAA